MAGQRFQGAASSPAGAPRTEGRPAADAERTLLLALEAAGLGLHDYDVLADDIHFDARARALWGVGPDERFDYAAFMAGLHPDDRATTQRAVEAALDPDGDGRYRAEYRVTSAADGIERIVRATGVVAFVDRRPVRLIGTLEDVTATRRARAALDAAQARLRLLDAIGEATRAASDAVTIMASATRLLGEHLGATRCAYADMEPDQDRFTIRDDWSPGVPSTRGTYSLELFGRSVARRLRAGETVAVDDVSRDLAADDGGATFRSIGIESVVCCPLVKGGRLTALMAVHHATARAWTAEEIGLIEQVVDRSWAHIERVRTAEHLREQDRRKDEFLAVLAHELRNPLAPIRTGLGVLAMDPAGPAADRARGTMARQLGHMVRLVDDLLDVSRISRGKLELRRERVAAQVVVEHALEASRPLLDAAGHHVQVTVPAEPVWVDGDLTRLAQVVQNLLNNSAKYTPHGGHIAVGLAVEAGDAVIRVTDDGEGIAPELLPEVFDLFAQGKRTLHRSQGGLGIGLSLARELTAMHGGTLTAESPGLGAGSTFTARLPRLRTAVEVAARVPTPRPAPGAPRRILIVDDNEDGAEMLATMLELGGHEIRTAHDGEAALAAARTFRPDLVFLDIGMPGLDGYDVARLLRADAELGHAQLVAVTGWGGAEAKERARQAGFDLHLTKPVDPARIDEILGR